MSASTLSLHAPKRLRYELFAHPLFLAMLLLKLASGSLFASKVLTDWFAPFVDYFVRSGFANPWEHFYQLGQVKAFPYPPGMLYVMSLPRLLASPWLGPDAGIGWLQLLLMRLPLLAGDIAIYAVLGMWFRDRLSIVRLWYWCSPIAFYVCYFHGQLDMIPTALFMLCLYFLEQRRHILAMLLFGAALSTKSHLWIALPFLLVYLNGRIEPLRLAGLALLAVATAALLTAPYYFDPSFGAMVLHNEEQSWVFKLAMPLGKWDTAFLLCPAALLLVFAKYAVYPRQNWDLTLLFLGLAFSVFVVLVPPMPGWYLWSLPFIIYYFCRFQRSPAIVLMLLSFSYLAYFVLGQRSDLLEGLQLLAPGLQWPAAWQPWIGVGVSPILNDLYFTLLQTSVIAAGLVMYTRGIRSNEVYGPRSRATMIGIAGDSGAGKDKATAMLTQLLGQRDVILLSGDDYHRWERGDRNWQQLTHLDPKSNRLHEQLEHSVALRGGRGIVKSSYDHDSGTFTRPETVDPRKNIIVQGLHSFLLEQQRRLFDLRVFMDPDERLRLFWKLRRDSRLRGHTTASVKAALGKRAKDRLASVLPQREHADLVFRLCPADPSSLKDLSADPELYLEVNARNSYNLESLAARLQQMDGVQVSVEYPKGLAKIRLRVHGQPLSQDIDRAALDLIPNLADLAGTRPKFEDGPNGVMMLVLLMSLSSTLRWKAPDAPAAV
jgi:uridine kinase